MRKTKTNVGQIGKHADSFRVPVQMNPSSRFIARIVPGTAASLDRKPVARAATAGFSCLKTGLFSSCLILAAITALVGCSDNRSASGDSNANTSTQPGSAAQSSSSKFTFSDLPVPPKPAVTPELFARGKTLYAQNCVACHGEKGDGKGDAAAFLAPKPRDLVTANYRLRSTGAGQLPTDVDLFRSISLGMPGTPMPPWQHMLAAHDRWALVEYLKSFSPRFADTNETRTALSDFGTPPPRNAAAIAEGKALYTKLNCFTCHGENGQGDGSAVPMLVDDSNLKIKPRDFRNAGGFKSGYAAKEIVRTIFTGFNGTPMVSFDGAVTKEDAWKVAYYVETMAKPAAAGPLNPGSQNFLSREELGAPDVKMKVIERAWKYDPDVIRVKKGQVVEITFEPTDNGLGVGHGLGISGYDEAAFINGVMVGAPKTVKFRADHTGTFTFYCPTQCSTEKLHPLMHGTLIVEDADAANQTASVH
jgi:mono/diheme cytochrome c family protein